MPVQRNFWMIGLSVAGGTLLCCAIAVLVALFGLGQIGSHTDLTALPAWLWYYRADPLLILWLKRGALAGAVVVGLLAIGILRRGHCTAPRGLRAKARSGGSAFAPLPASLSAAKLDVS
jgi:type IV secretion system protein VirD4